MAKPPRFISQVRGRAGVGPLGVQGPGVAAEGQRFARGLMDTGFDQLTRDAVQTAQIEGKKEGEQAATQGLEQPEAVPATIAGRARNQAAERAYVMRQSRMETIENVRSISNFTLNAQREMERLASEGDPTNPAIGDEYATYLENSINEQLANSNLSDAGKLQLQARLEAYRMDYAAQFGDKVVSEQEKMVGQSVMAGIRDRTAAAIRNPEAIYDHFNALDDQIDSVAAALTPDQELEYRDLGRQQIIKSSVTGLLANGRIREARALIEDTPGLIETMDPDEQRTILGGIVAAEKARAAAAVSGASKPMFQDMPIEGGQIQRVVSYDRGQTWRPFGTAYDRRDPFMVQEVVGEDGTIRQVAIRRDALGQAVSAAESGAGPAQDVEGLPPGAVVLSETTKAPTADQAKAEGFSARAAASNEILADVESEGLDIAGMAAEKAGTVGNFLKSDDRQKYEQARNDFVNAVLRRESGAAISESEFSNAEKQYFPEPGDSDAVIRQKRENRELAVESIANSGSASFRAQRRGIAGAAEQTEGSGAAPKKKQSEGGPKRIRLDLDGNVIE